jgi:uncharacterized protein (TIGR02453 family)
MRFRKDQAPYKTMMAARFPHRAFRDRTAPGLYLHLDPQHCFFACGLWHPDGDTRALVREAIIRDPQKWKTAARSKRFASIWRLSSESFKRLPPGVSPSHPLVGIDAKVCGRHEPPRLTFAGQIFLTGSPKRRRLRHPFWNF